MASLTLRRVGGSVVATFPKALLELLNATEGDTVEYTFDDELGFDLADAVLR